jgi:hypothetical protein
MANTQHITQIMTKVATERMRLDTTELEVLYSARFYQNSFFYQDS